MPEESRESRTRRYLAAFADGELDIEQTLLVLERLAMDPQATKRVVHQQQLRDAVARTIKAQSPPTPQALKDSIARLAQQTIPAARPTLTSRLTRWSPIAAVLVLSAIIGFQLISPPNVADASDRILEPQHVQQFTRRHVGCTRKTQQMMQTVAFPGDVKALPGSLEDYLSAPISPDALDLSALGYRFEAAGQCPVPGGRAVHLIYTAGPNSLRSDGLSLWIQIYTGRPKLDESRIYQASGKDAAHPFLVWRTRNLAYYLVGDSSEHVHEVAAKINAGIGE